MEGSNSKQKINKVINEIDMILTTPTKYPSTIDGIHRIVQQSNSLVMVTDLLQLRLRASQKKRRKSVIDATNKSQNIKKLLIQLQNSQNLLNQTLYKNKQLQNQCQILKAQLSNSFNLSVQKQLMINQKDELQKQNVELKEKLQNYQIRMLAQQQKHAMQINQLKNKRKLDKSEWKDLYQGLVQEIKKLKKQINNTINQQSSNNSYDS